MEKEARLNDLFRINLKSNLFVSGKAANLLAAELNLRPPAKTMSPIGKKNNESIRFERVCETSWAREEKNSGDEPVLDARCRLA